MWGLRCISNDFAAGATQELAEFAGHDAAAQDDDFFGGGVQVEDVVARPVRCVGKALYFRNGYNRPGLRS